MTYQNPYRPQPAPLEYGQDISPAVIARFFNSVYAWMAAGLAVTAAVAWWVASQPQVMSHVFSGGILIGLFIAELVLVFAISAAVRRIGPALATAMFILYAAINGVLFSSLLLVYAHALIATAFFVCAGTFAATSIFGFVTRRDLTSLGSFMFMGLIGLIIASVVSMFWHSTMLTVLINYAGVFIFIGLTAYDTQRLKVIAIQTQNDPRMAARLSINGALALYLDFVNLFLFILNILSGSGDRRR